MGHLRIKENEGVYKEKDRSVKEQFISSINDSNMMTEIIRELTAVKITREQVKCWAKRFETQTAQKAILQAAKENKEYNTE